MTITKTNLDELVDKFVLCANEAGFEPKFPNEVPEELRTAEGEWGTLHWRIRPAAPNPWIEHLTQQLPQAWPKPYLSLVQRYRFCNFTVGPVMFFANTGQDLFYELSGNVFKDKHLFPTLHTCGYLEFGKAAGGSYDPVCFDTVHAHGGDAPVVRLDHEEILTYKRIPVGHEIASSFAEFLRRAVDGKFPIC